MENKQEILNKIGVLNYLGYNIIEVIYNDNYSEFFSYINYESPSQFTNELIIKGKIVNGLIKNNEIALSKNHLQQQEILKTKIENLPIYYKRYSKDFRYIIHLSK